MPTLNSGFGRPADSQKRIISELRSRIVCGELAPGSQLPTRADIEAQFGAGPTTVQRALEMLRQDGFVQVRGRRGTFVSDDPPHLTRYAVVFLQPLLDVGHDSRFFVALRREVEKAVQVGGHDLSLYFGVDGHNDSEDFGRLVREVQEHRVAGLIFTSDPYELKHTPLLDEPGIPRVVISDPALALPYPVVFPDTHSFFVRALDDLKARGHRRIAFLNASGLCYDGPEADVLTLLAQRKMDTRPHWWQCVHLAEPLLARRTVQLLLHANQTERPDALVISDDNLVEYATAGVLAAGLRVPDDIEIIAHCNFPYPTPSVVPVKRLGYDARQVVEACVSLIDRQRSGKEVLPVTSILALFESELASENHPVRPGKKRLS